MADRTITETPLAGGKIRYELGRPNWEDRRIPDIRRPGATVQIDEQRLIDIIILGDGYTAASDFRLVLEDWLKTFYEIKVYDVFAGCMRVRALYTPSDQGASPNGGSYYGCLTSTDGHSIPYEWWKEDDTAGAVFMEAFWESVDTFANANTRRYPSNLDIGPSTQDTHSDELRDVYRNLVVAFLVRSSVVAPPTPSRVGSPPTPSVDERLSGFATAVSRPAPDPSQIRVAFGVNELHEFSHAFALLQDEYIKNPSPSDTSEVTVGRGFNNASRDHPFVDPATSSVFSLSNLTYSDRVDDVPWVHLSPCGWHGRTASGQAPSPLVGWLWVGGRGAHLGVWHSEYRCLMNGKHDNFQFTQIDAEDLTANADGTYTNENGADLRYWPPPGPPPDFCLWCQEIVTLRILEKTDQLLEDGDPGDVTSQGIVWYARWLERLRSNYYQLFDVAQQITDAEARYAGLTPAPGRNGEPLWQSDLYSVPKAAAAGPASPVPPASDDEVFLLTGFAAIP